MLKKTAIDLYAPAVIERQQPVNTDGSGVSGFYSSVDPGFKAVRLYRYRQVNVTPEGIVFRRLQIDRDLLIYPQHRQIYNWLYLASSIVKRKKVVLPAGEKYLLCFDYWSNSIFHWMCDALPRLEAVKELAKECVLLLPEFYEYTYIHETLKAFQFKDIFLMKDNSYVHCENLYAPEQITTSGQIRPDNILSLRQTLLHHFKPAFTGKINYPNIYVSRSKARFRKVLNEEELLPVLKKHGFELLYFEDFSVAEQIELCYHAVNLVSIHGANLTNIIFMQPGANVMELRKRNDTQNNYYYELADSAGCNYFHLDCAAEDPEPHKNTFSLHVDATQFDAALQQLIYDRPSA